MTERIFGIGPILDLAVWAQTLIDPVEEGSSAFTGVGLPLASNWP